MGRPYNPDFSIPSWSVPEWAPDTAYPTSADPWSATPTKIAHPGQASVGITPKEGVPAQCFNHVINAAFTADDATKTYATTLAGELQDSVEGLYDYLGAAFATSWRAATATIPGNTYCCAWNSTDHLWYVGGDDGAGNCAIYTTDDKGETWSANVIAGLATGAVWSMAVDTAGQVVAISNTRNVFKKSTGSGWAKTSNALGHAPAISKETAHIVYDPIHSKWCAVYLYSGSVLAVEQSTNGTAWTSGTPSSQLGANALFCNPTTGRIHALFTSVLTPAKLAYSDDSGSTWTNGTTFGTTAGATGAFAYDSVTGNVHVNPGYGPHYRSTNDGGAWTDISDGNNLTNLGYSFFVDGALISGTGGYLTTDGGTTWRRGSYVPSGVVFNGNEAVAATDQTNLWVTGFSVNPLPLL